MFFVITQDIHLGDYAGVDDSWMEVIGKQGESLLALDISSAPISDEGFSFIKGCWNLEALCMNYCLQISDIACTTFTGDAHFHIISSEVFV